MLLAGNDPSHQLQREVCSAFVVLAEVQMESILPHLEQIVPVMIEFTKDDDEEVALDACEFWSILCAHGFVREALRPHLPA